MPRRPDRAPGAPPSHVVVEFVSPGGVACREFADGGALVRLCAGILEADDGLLAEARSDAEPVPWVGRAAREEALASIGAASWLVEDDRALLLAHVARTPWFADD